MGSREVSTRKNSLPNFAVVEPQVEYGAELFEQYQWGHGKGQTVQAGIGETQIGKCCV